MADTLLGPAYMTASDFNARAASFGCAASALAVFSSSEIDAALSAASRAIEGYTNRSFLADPQVETQQVDFYTRRVRVDKPPVASIVSATLQTYPTPTTMLVSQLVVNNQENYIEIPSGQLGGFQTPNTAEYPDIVITYTSGQTLPPQAVISAVGFVAAELLNRGYANRLVAGGLSEVTTGKQTVSRAPFDPNVKSIPEIARQILAGDPSLSPRVVPRGYPSRYLKGAPQYRVP